MNRGSRVVLVAHERRGPTTLTIEGLLHRSTTSRVASLLARTRTDADARWLGSGLLPGESSGAGVALDWGAMTIKYRMAEYGDFDLESVVDIAHAIRSDDYESAAALGDWHAVQKDAGRLCARWLASLDGRIISSAYVGQSSWIPPTTIVI